MARSFDKYLFFATLLKSKYKTSLPGQAGFISNTLYKTNFSTAQTDDRLCQSFIAIEQ